MREKPLPRTRGWASAWKHRITRGSNHTTPRARSPDGKGIGGGAVAAAVVVVVVGCGGGGRWVVAVAVVVLVAGGYASTRENPLARMPMPACAWKHQIPHGSMLTFFSVPMRAALLQPAPVGSAATPSNRTQGDPRQSRQCLANASARQSQVTLGSARGQSPSGKPEGCLGQARAKSR